MPKGRGFPRIPMNDLSLYNSALAQFPPDQGFPIGTLIGFQGPLHDPLDLDIDIVTRSRWTHVGAISGRNLMVECTRPMLWHKGTNGVQQNFLSSRLLNAEPGTAAAAFILTDYVQSQMNVAAFSAFCSKLEEAGIPYDVGALVKFLFKVPQVPNTNKEVCSVFVSFLYEASNVYPPSLDFDASMQTPKMVVEHPGMYKQAIPILGKPDLRGFVP